MVVALIISAVIIIVDQVTKATLYGMSCSLIGDFLWLESTLNTGASFGMLKGGTILFIVITIPMIALMVYLICSNKVSSSRFFKICLGVLLGGTIGNLIDRIFIGGVRDFIYFKSINFAIFNVADIAITVGTIMLVIVLVIDVLKPRKTEGSNKNENSRNGEEG